MILTTDIAGGLTASGGVKCLRVRLLNNLMIQEITEYSTRERHIGEIVVIPRALAMELIEINRAELAPETETKKERAVK
jgi:hypothetical protein